MISGSIGMLASASLAQGTFGLYEPIHGSAPDIAGQGKANPLATILSGAMMLRYTFDEAEAADAIENAVDIALTKARTPDIYEDGFEAVNTSQMGDLVASLYNYNKIKTVTPKRVTVFSYTNSIDLPLSLIKVNLGCSKPFVFGVWYEDKTSSALNIIPWPPSLSIKSGRCSNTPFNSLSLERATHWQYL